MCTPQHYHSSLLDTPQMSPLIFSVRFNPLPLTVSILSLCVGVLPATTCVWLQRALLYSGVNQLACGRHSGEDHSRNALKTMQRAVLLCPGKAMMITHSLFQHKHLHTKPQSL